MADQNLICRSDQQFRKVELVYFGMFFSLVIYLAIGFWLRPNPALSSKMKETIIFTRLIFFLSAAFIALTFILQKKKYNRPHLVPPSLQAVLKKMRFYKLVGHLFQMGSVQHFLNLILVSIILMVSFYPRKFAEGNS